jgi:hypothetical protein
MARADSSSTAGALNADTTLLKSIASRLGLADRLNVGNTTKTPLANGGSFVGPWVRTGGLSAVAMFASCDQPLTTARVEWSSDGVTANSGAAETSDYTTSETLVDGSYIYDPDPETWIVGAYVRLVLENAGTSQGTLEAYFFTFPDGTAPYTFVDMDGDLPLLSKGLLTRTIGAATEVTLLEARDLLERDSELEVLADQAGADAVLTFTFAGGAALPWVSVDTGDPVRVTASQTPTASFGIPVAAGSPFPVPLAATVIKVWAASGQTVTVYGTR